MNCATAKSLTAKKFKRRFGVEKKTFERMLTAFNQQIPEPPRLRIKNKEKLSHILN